MVSRKPPCFFSKFFSSATEGKNTLIAGECHSDLQPVGPERADQQGRRCVDQCVLPLGGRAEEFREETWRFSGNHEKDVSFQINGFRRGLYLQLRPQRGRGRLTAFGPLFAGLTRKPSWKKTLLERLGMAFAFLVAGQTHRHGNSRQ